MADIVLGADTRRPTMELRLMQGFVPLDTEEHHAGNVDMREWSDCQLGIEPPYTFCGAQGSRASLESGRHKIRSRTTLPGFSPHCSILRGILCPMRVRALSGD